MSEPTDTVWERPANEMRAEEQAEPVGWVTENGLRSLREKKPGDNVGIIFKRTSIFEHPLYTAPPEPDERLRKALEEIRDSQRESTNSLREIARAALDQGENG